MKYFVNYPYTAESLKAEYRALCLTMHPDKGGNADEFNAMSAEYSDILASLTNGNGTTANKTRTAATDDTTAQDFADLMGAPLKGTKGKTFADLVAELADIMADENRRKLYESEGETWGCYGWDGCAMTPESRTAYVKKFGRTVIEMAELCATMKQAADAKAYEQTHHAAHVREARKHQSEGNKAPKAGAFVFGVGCNWKSDGGRGVFVNFEAFAHNPEEYGTQYDDDERRHLCKVVEVIEVSAEDFARPELADELVKKAHDEGREFAGGFTTDDPEPADDPRDPHAKYKYYYTKVAAVVCRESGRWYLIDSEGYSYARYTYMPTSWRTMYAQEIREAQRKQAERDEQERQEEERKAAERLAEYRAKCAKYEAAGLEDLTELREAVTAANREESEAGRAHGWRSPERKAAGKRAQAAAAALMAAEKRNIKRMAETAYPGIKCKVTKAESWRSAGYKLTYEDGPTLEQFQNNTDFDLFAAYWQEYRMDDCTEYHRYDLTEFADKYGDGRGVEIAREMSKAERERMTAAILQAVPAAAGICWENRHAWTQEEVTAAAAAVGVDGWELWKVYDHKHTYFNYVDAESLAEWAHELTAYDIKGKKTRNRTSSESNAESISSAAESRERKATATTSAQSESKPQETATAAEGTDTKADTAEAVTEAQTAPTASADETTAPTSSDEGDRLTMEQYSEKATVIRGYNAQQAAELEAMGGKEWRNLRGGKGYIFSTRRHGDELREWMKQQQGEGTAAPAADEPTATASVQADETQAADTTATATEADTLEGSGQIGALLEAVADLFRTLSDICKEAKKFEGVTIPAATLRRWRDETEKGTKQAAERFAEVCACLGSLTPDSRRDFDALGVIFWTLSEQIRNGYDPATINPATDYARAQLFDLIERTQTPQQAAAVRAAFSPEEYPDYFNKAA